MIPKTVCKTPGKCRLNYGGGSSTLLGWMPQYDGFGNLLNQDPNKHTQNVSCSTCGRSFVVETQYGKEDWHEVKLHPDESQRLLVESYSGSITDLD